MRIDTSRVIALSIWLLAISLIIACQRPEDRQIALTQAQWQTVQEHLLDEAPQPEHPIGVEFADQIELIGVDIDGTFAPGEEIELVWYWRALADVERDWKIFVHLDSEEHRFRQNLDHFPLESTMNEAYRTYHLQEGHILADAQSFTLRDDYPTGEALFHVGLFHGERRASISNDGPTSGADRAQGPTVQIVESADEADHQSTPQPRHAPEPSHGIPYLSSQEVEDLTLDGKLHESMWHHIPSLRLAPVDDDATSHAAAHPVYTDDHLIIGARIVDNNIWATIDEDGADLLDEEAFVAVIARQADGPFVEIQVNPLGTVSGFAYDEPGAEREPWNPDGLDVGVFVDGRINDQDEPDRYWSMELRIPLAHIPLAGEAPEEGEQWKVNLYRIDRPDDERRHLYAWSAVDGDDLHLLDRFGTWTFGAGMQQAPTPFDLQNLSDDDMRELHQALQDQIREHTESRQLPAQPPATQ